LTLGTKYRNLSSCIKENVASISVIGSGYIGLVTGIGLAMSGHDVTCIDCDNDIVTKVNNAVYPFYEPSLDGLLEKCVNIKQNLRASADFYSISHSEASFICVGTFSKAENKTNFKNIITAVTQVGIALRESNHYHLVVIKSTVPPGTTEDILLPILEKYSLKKAGEDFGLVVNPEFIQEGNASRSSLDPDRIIIGEYDRRSGDRLTQLYYSSCACPIIRTKLRTAEMVKYASNAYLATKITFINEIGNICKELGIDVYDVPEGMGYDPRIVNKFLKAGIGFGGSCLPKDLDELIIRARQIGYPAPLLTSVLNLNSEQPLRLIKIAENKLTTLVNKTITVLGIAFKAGTDDVRDAPSLKIISYLLDKRARIKIYDPRAIPLVKNLLDGKVEFCNCAQEAIQDSDCVLIATDWDEFKDKRLYRDKVVIDGRRVLDPRIAGEICAYYEGVCW